MVGIALGISISIFLVVMIIVLIRSKFRHEYSDDKIIDFIKENSTRYRSVMRCKNEVEEKCIKFDSIVKYNIRVCNRDEFDRYNIKDAEKEIVNILVNEIEFRVSNVKFNAGILSEFQARVEADYSDYSMEEHLRLNRDDVSYERYIELEDSVIKHIEPNVNNFFIVTITVELFINNDVIDSKEFSFSMFDAYRILHVKKEVVIDKKEEKFLVKERLKKDNYVCQVCGRKKSDKLKVGVKYVVPLSNGGSCDIENMRTVCTDCYKRV